MASTLRRANSKRPRLQNKSRKAGALLLTRRSVDATPSREQSRHCGRSEAKTRNLPINRHSDESQNPLMQRGIAGQARNDGVKRGMTSSCPT
jgi:hypothetical protein